MEHDLDVNRGIYLVQISVRLVEVQSSSVLRHIWQFVCYEDRYEYRCIDENKQNCCRERFEPKKC